MPFEANALTRIINFVEKENLQEMIKWSDRSRERKSNNSQHRYLRKLKKRIRIILNIFSGNDIATMLKGNYSSPQQNNNLDCFFQIY